MISLMSGYGTFADHFSTKTPKREARWKNSIEFHNTMVHLTNLYLNQFEWTNLPQSVSARFLEEVLYFEGAALFFNDDALGYMALPVSGEGDMNAYFEFTKYRVNGNRFSKTIAADASVLIRENQMAYPPVQTIESFAIRQADASRTIDVYSKTMKKPWLISVDKDDHMTAKTLTEDIDNNELLIVGSKRTAGMLTAASVNQNPQDGNGLGALWKHKHEWENSTLTWIGINNANTDKRERMITDEVNSNNEVTELNLALKLDWRKKAAEDINKMFGLNVGVRIKHEYKEVEAGATRKTDNDTRVDS